MRVIVGQSEWGIDNKDLDTVVELVKVAMEKGEVATLPLLDGANRPVTVYLNGKVAPTVAIDIDEAPRPSEIS
jgi:hypothetical protein